MKQIGPDGDLVFSTTEFGSGSVSKTEQISEILKNLLSNIVVTTRSEDTELLLKGYYTAIQIDDMLKNYVLLTKLSTEVATQLNNLLNSPEFSGKYASQTDLLALNEAIKDYSSDIETIKGNQTSLQSAWIEYKNQNTLIIEQQTQLIERQNAIVDTLNSNYSSLAQSVSSVQVILDKLDLINLAEFSSQINSINSKLDKIGELVNLKTSDKTSLVSAINELVDKSGDLTMLSTTDKSSLVNAINELFQSASDGKSLIAAAITGKGVSAAASESFSSLAAKITSIPTGVDTSDATASASDIAKDKTAYVKGNKLVGTHECSGGSGGDLSSKITFLDSADHLTYANQSTTIASNNAGIFICTSMEAICANGCDTCYGDINYVIDGTPYSVDNYNIGDKISFTSSLVLQVGDLTYESSGSDTCDLCGKQAAVVQWGGVLVLE